MDNFSINLTKLYDLKELNQKQLYLFKAKGFDVILVDTLLKPISTLDFKVLKYDPFVLEKLSKENSILVFYCDSGKTSLARLDFFKARLKGFRCYSLKNGRAYWRQNFQA